MANDKTFLLTINDVVGRTGTRTCTFSIPGRELLDGGQITEASFREPGRNRFLVLSLEKRFGQFIAVRPDLPPEKYSRGMAARRFVGNLLPVSAATIDANNYVVMEIDGPLRLELIVEVNTDHPELVKVIDARDPLDGRGRASPGGRPTKVELTVSVVMIDQQRQTAQSRVAIDLMLAPVQNMPTYPGYAALDFGNTSTTLVLSGAEDEHGFELVPADVRRRLVEGPRPVQTALRISRIRPAAEKGGPTRYDAVIGGAALEQTDASWLVLGAKRLLSDRKAAGTATEVVLLGNERHEIPAEEPAEVYISQMMQGLFFHQQKRLQSVAITCPTTFTASEVGRLRRTVARACERALGRASGNLRDERAERMVPLVIDEASAAAFYFAYRDFVAGPGKMPGFRYLYPNGMHLLIYDCGGGTTDLALVRLEAPSDTILEISVLGRAGHRQFGGDFITERVFRLLKAKLAAAKRAVPEFPRSPAQIQAYLDANAAAIDRAVPTTYDLGQMQNDDAQRRRRTTLDLWRLAESTKVRLSAKGVQAVNPGEDSADADLMLMTEVCNRVGWPAEMEAPDVAAELQVSRKEIDALIDPEIDKTIGYANDLIRDGMQQLARDQAAATREPPLEIPEVDRVYVVGNASRYPRIKERLLDPDHGLHVRFLEDRLAEVRPEDFKNSVAKGAIVALRMSDMRKGVQISWDEKFMNRLPFDLINDTLATAGDSVLFRRGTPYSAAMRAHCDIAPDPRTGQPTTRRVRLDRKWPGEQPSEPCMIFQFDEPIVGRFVIRYDEEHQTFVMHPDRKGGEDEMLAVAEPFEAAPYLAPPQSGRI